MFVTLSHLKLDLIFQVSDNKYQGGMIWILILTIKSFEGQAQGFSSSEISEYFDQHVCES